ncbi:hypothetical protein ACTFIV_004053 [Dictyostelium citrinum]
MMGISKSLFFVIFFILFNYINSQNAINSDAFCQKKNITSICDPYLFNTDSIYIYNSTITQESIEAELKSKLGIFSMLQLTCQVSSTYRLICNQYFQTCVSVSKTDNSSTIAIPLRPCRESCDYGNEICGTQTIIPCTGTFTEPTIYKFPVTANVFDLSSLNGPSSYSLECLNIDTMRAGDLNSTYVPTNETIILDQTCVYPLIYRNSTNREDDVKKGYQYLTETSDCLLPCPVPFFTENQWYQFKDLTTVTGAISFVCIFFNIFIYGFLNKKHDRHTIGILCLSFSLWCCMLSDLIVASSPDYSLVCPEPGRFARIHDSRCVANGIIFQWGAVCTTMFWSAMAIDLYLVIKKLSPPAFTVKYFVIAIFILAILFTTVPLAWDDYGYGFGGVGCWIMSNSVQNGCFWIPMLICLLIGAVSICLIIFEIVKIFKNVGRSGLSIVLANARLFGIVSFIFIEYIYLFVYHFWVQENTEKFTQNITDWVVCVQTSGSADGCPLPKAVPYATQFIFLFFLRLLGIEVCIFYGINSRSKNIILESDLVNNKYFKAIRTKISSVGATSTTKNNSSTINTSDQFNSTMFSVEVSKNGGDDDDL